MDIGTLYRDKNIWLNLVIWGKFYEDVRQYFQIATGGA